MTKYEAISANAEEIAVEYNRCAGGHLQGGDLHIFSDGSCRWFAPGSRPGSVTCMHVRNVTVTASDVRRLARDMEAQAKEYAAEVQAEKALIAEVNAQAARLAIEENAFWDNLA